MWGNHGVDGGEESVLIEDIMEKSVYLRLHIQYLPASYAPDYVSSFATSSACCVNFARRFFFKFSRKIQVILGSFQTAHSFMRANPSSGAAAVITLRV